MRTVLKSERDQPAVTCVALEETSHPGRPRLDELVPSRYAVQVGEIDVMVGGLLVDGVRERLRPDLRVHVAAAEAEFWESPDFSRVNMPSGFPDALRRTAKRFLNEYDGQLRPFETEYEVAPGVVVRRTGGHTPGHSVVRLASGGDRLTFAGDAVFQVGFEHPDWYNGFEHDPEEAARVRVRLLRELAANGSLLVATHMPFPSVGHVAVAGDAFRWVPAFWDY